MEDKGHIQCKYSYSTLAWNVKPEPNQEEASENPKLEAFS